MNQQRVRQAGRFISVTAPAQEFKSFGQTHITFALELNCIELNCNVVQDSQF